MEKWQIAIAWVLGTFAFVTLNQVLGVLKDIHRELKALNERQALKAMREFEF